MDWVATSILAFPVLACLLLSLVWWLNLPLNEQRTARLANSAFFLSSTAAFAILSQTGGTKILIDAGRWYSIPGYDFTWTGALDPLSLISTGLAAFLLGVIGYFSRDYLHQERGFLRFYLLTLVLGVGVEIVLLSARLDQIFFGWELVGLSSALLIGFFSHRPGPAKGAARAFLTYRFCDIGLLSAVVLVHHVTGSTALAASGSNLWFGLPPSAHHAVNIGLVLLLVFACMGKSAMVPFGGWLPRAMEGPTPSSAVFYGALSIHLGPYLLLRCAPLLSNTPGAGAILATLGLSTAIHGTLVGRVQPDVKSALAYGSMTQVGLIFIEIGLGWYTLALLHIVGHACIRTLEILRAPSVLHDYQNIELSLGVVLPRMGLHLERNLPRRWQLWLYHRSLERGFSESVLLHAVNLWKAAFHQADRAERFIETRIMGLSAPGQDKVEALR